MQNPASPTPENGSLPPSAEAETTRRTLFERLASAALWAVAIFVVYSWCVRISCDLVWDEGHNLRVYARHPAAALGLYREPNNHVVDSATKSVFYGLLKLDDPAYYRFAGFLWVLALLAVAVKWRDTFASKGGIVAGTLAVVLLLLARHVHFHAMYMRGYFPSIVIASLYLLALARDAGLAGFDPAPRWTTRRAWAFGGLTGLLLWTVPTNLFLLPALWPATLASYRHRVDETTSGFGAAVRAALALAATSALTTVVLYAPILVGLATGVSDLHKVPVKAADGFEVVLGEETARLLAFARPGGLAAAPFAVGLAVLFGGATLAAVVAPRRRRAASIAFMLGLGAAVALIASVVATKWPERARSPFVAPIVAAIALAAHVATAGWPRPAARALAAAIAVASLALLPAVADETKFHREATDAVALARGVARAESRPTIVCHDDLQDLYFPIRNAFGPSRVVASRDELQDRFAGEKTKPDYPEGSWKRRLRDALFPKPPVEKIEADDVGALVFVEADYLDVGAVHWRHPDFDRVMARLSKETRFALPPYVVILREAP